MKTVPCGNSELNFTRIGLGTWAIGGGNWVYGWGPQDDRESLYTIQKALDLGINWIDTAAVYGLGHSEEIIGSVIGKLRKRPFIATKCGLIWDKNGTVSGCLKRQSILKEADASLRRLKIDTIDLYQLHWPNPNQDIEEAWTAMAELIECGKIRYAGVSNFNVHQLERAMKIHPVTSLQPPYSLLKREIEEEILPFCRKHSIGVISYSPMQRGLLSGKMTLQRAENFPDNDHRHRDPLFNPPLIKENLALADDLNRLASQYGYNVAQLAIAWVLNSPGISAAIVGSRKPWQVQETLKAAAWNMDEALKQSIQQRLDNHSEKILMLTQDSD